MNTPKRARRSVRVIGTSLAAVFGTAVLPVPAVVVMPPVALPVPPVAEVLPVPDPDALGDVPALVGTLPVPLDDMGLEPAEPPSCSLPSLQAPISANAATAEVAAEKNIDVRIVRPFMTGLRLLPPRRFPTQY